MTFLVVGNDQRQVLYIHICGRLINLTRPIVLNDFGHSHVDYITFKCIKRISWLGLLSSILPHALATFVSQHQKLQNCNNLSSR